MIEHTPPDFLGEEQALRARHARAIRRRRLFFVLCACVVLFAITLPFFRHERGSDDPLAYNPVTLEPKKPEGIFRRLSQAVFTRDTVLSGEREDRINILLLGMGGEGHDGPYLTDTIILASVKPSTRSAALISIPRDLAVAVPRFGVQKINHINSIGEEDKKGWGGAYTTETLSKIFDTEIPYYIRVDFKAFAEIVDAVGGIRVSVDRAFTDETYPDENDGYQTITFAQGVQTMDGAKALTFARSRHGNNGEGSDFARARRQQKVLLALKEKVLSFETLANPVKIHAIIQSLDRHLTTNMTFPEMMALLKMAKSGMIDHLQSLVFDDGPKGFLKNGFTESGAFILSPKTGTFDDINRAIADIFVKTELAAPDTTPIQEKPTLNSASVEIQNGTWSAGLAARMRKRLEDKGFLVADIGNTQVRPQPVSGIYILSPSAPNDIVQALEAELKFPRRPSLPKDIIPLSHADILVIVGSDMQE